MIDALLRALQRFTGPVAIADALISAGAQDLVDVAILEYFLFQRRCTPEAIEEWVELWPMLGRYQKPRVRAQDVPARLENLVKKQLLTLRQPDYELTPKALQCFPIVIPRKEAGDDVAMSIRELVSTLKLADEKGVGERVAQGLAALTVGAGAELDDAVASELAVEVVLATPASLQMAATLLQAVLGSKKACSELQSALLLVQQDLKHPARDAGPSRAAVARWAVMRFVDNVLPAFSLKWFGTPTHERNDLRCEWLLRCWAAYLGVSVQEGDLRETPLDSARKLVLLDHRREQLFRLEKEFQADVQQKADEWIGKELTRRAEAAKAAAALAAAQAQDPSYAGGRRE